MLMCFATFISVPGHDSYPLTFRKLGNFSSGFSQLSVCGYHEIGKFKKEKEEAMEDFWMVK